MAQDTIYLPENEGRIVVLEPEQVSSMTTKKSKRSVAKKDDDFVPDPMRATMMATSLPGLGQIYNRKYWKIPIVYAGFGGVAFSISYFSKQYNTYMQAYQDFMDEIPETNSYTDLITADPSTYDPVLHPSTYNTSNAAWYRERMLSGIDYYKKYRDLSYLGIAAWYLITILDAHVDACLFNYDVSSNIDIAVSPLQQQNIGYASMGVNVSLRYTF